MRQIEKKPKTLYLNRYKEDDSKGKDIQPNDAIDPINSKGGSLFPGSDDDD